MCQTWVVFVSGSGSASNGESNPDSYRRQNNPQHCLEPSNQSFNLTFDDFYFNNTFKREISLFDQKLQLNYVQATGEAFSSQKRTSSTSKMKFINFLLCLWVIFVLPDPDSDCEAGSRYGSRDSIESGSTVLPVSTSYCKQQVMFS